MSNVQSQHQNESGENNSQELPLITTPTLAPSNQQNQMIVQLLSPLSTDMADLLPPSSPLQHQSQSRAGGGGVKSSSSYETNYFNALAGANESTATNPFTEDPTTIATAAAAATTKQRNETITTTIIEPKQQSDHKKQPQDGEGEAEEEEEEGEEEKLKKKKNQNLYALEFEKSSTQDEVAHRHIEALKNKFKNFSSDVQNLVERNVRKNLEAFEAGRNPNDSKKNFSGRTTLSSKNGEAKDLIIYQQDKKKRLNPEELDGYQDADVLLSVLRVTERLALQRATGASGKMSIFGVLTPSHELQEKWKQQEKTEELSRLLSAAQADSDMIIPTRAEAGAAFGGSGAIGTMQQLTQMRGRKIPKLDDTTSSNENNNNVSAVVEEKISQQ
jgi:hypothetical protein